MSRSTLLFSIALNGYEQVFRECIASQAEYARKHGYRYVAVTKPRGLLAPADCAWLKIACLQKALEAGHDWVCYIDADCEIRENTPAIETLAAAGKYLYMAKGFSGRVNAGLMVARNSGEIRKMIATIMDAADRTDLPEEDRAPYENGHVIHYTRDSEILEIIDGRWNNNIEMDLDDYIRHYSGKIRQHYPQLLSRLNRLRDHRRGNLLEAIRLCKELGIVGWIRLRRTGSQRQRVLQLAEFCGAEFLVRD
jgi:hypothetical protein